MATHTHLSAHGYLRAAAQELTVIDTIISNLAPKAREFADVTLNGMHIRPRPGTARLTILPRAGGFGGEGLDLDALQARELGDLLHAVAAAIEANEEAEATKKQGLSDQALDD